MGKNTLEKDKQIKGAFKAEMQKHTSERILQYRRQEERVVGFLERNKKYPEESRKKDKVIIDQKVNELKETYDEIVPSIYKMREYIPDVLAQDRMTACYLIFGKIYQSWQAVFLLARDGFHYEVMELLRSISESTDLFFLFMIEEDDNVDVSKWFTGEIIDNSKSRQVVDDYMNKTLESDEPLLIGAMKANIYSGISKYTHISYSALLDSFDVFNRDFDFERSAGFHYTANSSLSFAQSIMDFVIIALRFFYKNVNDVDSLENINAILEKRK